MVLTQSRIFHWYLENISHDKSFEKPRYGEIQSWLLKSFFHF